MVQLEAFLSSEGHWTVSGEGFVIIPHEEGVERTDTMGYLVEVSDAGKTLGCTEQLP